MRTNSLNNSFSLLNYKNLNSIGRYIATIAAILFLALPQAWGAGFYSRLQGKVGDGSGNVYVSTSTKPNSPNTNTYVTGSSKDGGETTFYIWAEPDDGYYFVNWVKAKENGTITPTEKTDSTMIAVCKNAYSSGANVIRDKREGNFWNYQYYMNYTVTANFAAVQVNTISDASYTFSPLVNAKTTCSDYKKTITFTTEYADEMEDFYVSLDKTAGDGIFDFDGSPSITGNTVTATVKFTGNNRYAATPGASRVNTATLTLTSKGDATQMKKCDFFATFPDPLIESATSKTPAPATPTTIVEGTATFNTKYADAKEDFNIPTFFSDVETEGVWTITGSSYNKVTNSEEGEGQITITYTFNPDSKTGNHSAKLTLSAKNGGASLTVLCSANVAEISTDDAQVNAKNGDLLKKGTWADCLAVANANEGSTLKLLRDVKGLTAKQTISQTITLDLNRYTLSGTLTTEGGLLSLNAAGKVLTITDTQSGGKISATGNAAAALTAVLVDKGSLVLTKGDIEIENTNTGASAAAKAVKIAAGARFVQTAGNLKATSAGTGAYGLEVTTNPADVNMVGVTGGTITATAATAAVGVNCLSSSATVSGDPTAANVVLSGVTVNAETTGTTDAYAVRTAAGVMLGITNGTYNATAKTTTAYTLHTSGYTAVVNGTFNATAKEKIARAIHVVAGITAVNNGIFNAKAQTEKAHTCYVASGAKLLTYGGTFHGKLENAASGQYATGAYIDGTLEAQGGTFIGEVAKTGLAAAQTNYATGVCLATTATNVTIASATLRGVTDNNFVNGAHALYTTTTNEVNLTNCTLMASSANSYAYGVRVEGATPLKMKNCLVTAEAATSYTYGFYQNNATSTIEVANSKFTITSNNIYAYGAHVNNGTFTAKNCDFVVKTKQTTATAAANSFLRGIYVNTGKRAYLTGCTIDASGNATYSKEGYGIYVDGSADVDDCNVAVSDINSGAYAIYNSTKTTAINVASGKFKATAATGKFVETNATAAAAKQKLYGGYYVHNTNLSNYLPTGYGIETLPTTAAEYAEGYRYAVRPPANLEKAVCKIGAVGYSTLEEALEYAGKNATGNNELIILMVADYTLPAGDYVLPPYTTLLVPMKDQTTPIKASVERLTQQEAKSCNNLLTLASGVHLSVYGTIETGSRQFAGSGAAGYQTGSYGRIHTDTGVRIDLESGSTVYCWGYITGGAEIHAKRNSTIYEHFEIGDFKGGGVASTMLRNTMKVFVVTHYFYQSIEATVVYHPGSKGLGSSSVQANGSPHPADGVKIVGETGSGSLFLMDANDARENTWLKKEYNPATERATWTLNSGATLGSLTISITGYQIESQNFILPIASHMDLKLNYGAMTLNQSTYFMPGSKFEIGREATLKIPTGAELYFIDQENWAKGYSVTQYICTPNFSPTRSGNGPRHGMKSDKTTIPDAEFFIHGTVEVSGKLYTSDPGANLHSTNEDAGKVIFTSPTPSGSTTFYQCNDQCGCNLLPDWLGGGCSGTYYWGKQEHTCYSAKLKNENGNYVSTAGVAVGTKYIYKNDEWVKITTDGCLEVETISGAEHKYAYTTEFVEVAANSSDNAYHDAAHEEGAEGCRYFIYTEKAVTSEGCVWWEATKEREGLYKAKLPDHNGKINYYTFDAGSGYWKVWTVTVKWMNTGSTVADYTVGYNTVPEYLDPTPTKTSTSSEYYYTWTGWTKGSETGEFFSKDEALPKVTENTTYYAYFEAHKYEYTITMKNYDGTFLEAKRWAYGEKPLCETLPIKPATTSKEYSFDGWSTSLNGAKEYEIANLPSAVAAATYYAHFAEADRQYTIQWVNYNGTVLKEEQVAYNSTPVVPVAPTRPNDSYYTYTFEAWSPSISEVTGNQTYTATYTYEKKVPKYIATFKNGSTTIYTQNLVADAHPVFDGTIPTKKADAQYTYTFDGWSTTDGGARAYASGDELPALTADVTYYAHFAGTTNSYKVLWKSEDGKVLYETDASIEYGATPEYNGSKPTKPRQGATVYTFDGWSATIGGAKIALPSVTGNATYYAHFSEETGFYADIVDVDNSEKTLKLNVSGTEWVTAGWPYEVNDTVYYRDQAKATAAGSDKYRATDRTLTIPYTVEPGENFTVTIRNASSTLVSKHTYIIPQEIKSATTLTTDQTAPIFVKGATLTVDADMTIKNIYVAPGAKLVVNTGVTLKADTVFLRTTPWASAELDLNGTITGQVCYTRIILSKSGYFQFGLPLSCPISAVRLSNGKTVGYKSGTGWILRYYDEDKRATTGPGDNWATLDAAASIAAGRGYEMYSGVDYYREFYFPVDLSQMTNTVHVDYTAGEQPTNNGWNVLVSPLTHTFTNTPQPEGMKISWMQLDGSFLQEPLTTVAPAMTFAYQAVKKGSLVFDGSNVTVPTLAPRRVAAVEEATRIQWMHLDIKDANGLGDQTSIYSHPTRYDQTFKMGVDEEKQSLTASRALLYSSHAYGEMAFAGVADELLEQGVALTVYSPKTQELTISMRENEWLNRMVSVWLIDKATGAQIDLLESDYSFSAEAGTTAGRFILMGAFFAPQITTDNGTVQGDDEDIKAKKFIYKDKMYIQINGVIYDATGKLVK